MILWIAVIAAGFYLAERFWPANALPKVANWWPRVVFVNAVQLGIIVLAGATWDRWLQPYSLIRLRDHFNDWTCAGLAYLLSTLVFYGWHRWRHESAFFWKICHQLHHSPSRIELVTSFYKHPLEIAVNSVISAGIVYLLLGCNPVSGAYYTLLTAIAEFFYHWNVRTPRWLGYWIQRPESHRIHHQYRHHTQNFADLPIWDIVFGTFANAEQSPPRCGYDDWREDRIEDMLVFRDLHAEGAEQLSPLHFLPTCIGCGKRWACAEARQKNGEEPVTSTKPDASERESSRDQT